jgi:hypothetical protein
MLMALALMAPDESFALSSPFAESCKDQYFGDRTKGVQDQYFVEIFCFLWMIFLFLLLCYESEESNDMGTGCLGRAGCYL